MLIRSINNSNNTNFKALHVTPTTLKKIGCTKDILLSNPEIKKCADKYDVLVTAGDKKYTIDRRDGFTKDKILPTAYLIGTIWSAPHIVEWLTALGINDIKILIGTCAAMLGGAMLSLMKLVTKRVHEINILGAQAIVPVDKVDKKTGQPNEFRTIGVERKYTTRINNYGVKDDVPDIAEKIEDEENLFFKSFCLSNLELDNMFTPINYLKNLKKVQKDAQEQNIKDVFKYPVNKGGDTLLTMFFDVTIPDKKDSAQVKAYYAILQEIAKTDKSNFNQKDSYGIPIFEKIMRTENEYILPMLKGCKFSFSPFLKYAYENIQNQLFKKILKSQVDFDFDLLEKCNEN